MAKAIAESIRGAVIYGALQPGQRVKEEELARQFGVSRTPIREAFQLLQREGLLLGSPKRGVTIRAYQKSELDKMYRLRAFLEGYAAREAAERIQAADVERLRRSCERFEVGRASEDFLRLIEENLVFHDIILEAADDERLTRIVHELIAVPYIYRAYFWYSPHQRDEVERHHRLIVDALEARDGDRAERLIKDHILTARDVVVKTVVAITGGGIPTAER
jgi:DNA-binding GntR family transcriptional regulator